MNGAVDFAERHILAALAGPVITRMVSGGDRAIRAHQWVVALHEAAHAAVGTVLGLRLEAVSVLPESGRIGCCRYRRGAAGPVPEAVPLSDDSRAACMAWLSGGCPDWRQTRHYLRQLRERARELVVANLYPIHRLAETLRAHYELAGDEAEEILAAARAELWPEGSSGKPSR